MLYIIIAILMFGVLIAVHEFGHFITAKLLGVRVNEFSIGMGPKLWGRQKGETAYSLRLLPIGGYCALEGEEEDTGDPRAFQNKSAWRKAIILLAGSFMNLLTGLVIILLLSIPAVSYNLPVVGGFLEGYGVEDCGLQAGDRFLSVDGHGVWTYSDAKFLLDRAGDTVDLVVERDGERVVLEDLYLPFQQKESEEGVTWKRGLLLGAETIPATLGTRVVMSLYEGADMVRMVWFSLGDLVRGAVGFQDLSGPIGIVGTVGELGTSTASTAGTGAALWSVFYLMAFIAVNLAVMNLLPIPALDGGRIFFLILGVMFRRITRRELDPKYENAVNTVWFIGLLGLMAAVAVNDVIRLI